MRSSSTHHVPTPSAESRGGPFTSRAVATRALISVLPPSCLSVTLRWTARGFCPNGAVFADLFVRL